MHLLRTVTRLTAETEAAVDLGQTPADIVFLSFSDSDLGSAAAAWESLEGEGATMRLAPLGMLKHPYSVDLHVEGVASRARFVLVRLLGGLDYWRYGAEELAEAARRNGFELAVIPGDARPDKRLDELSTLPPETLRRIEACFRAGDAASLALLFRWIARRVDGADEALPPPAEPPPCGRFEPACRAGTRFRAAIVFYRAHLLAADTAPVTALADALAARGFAVEALYVPSLKERAAAAYIRAALDRLAPDIVLNTTAFACRPEAGSGPLDAAGAPVFQIVLAGTGRADWAADGRGLSAADLAMNVVLPEIDGRIITRAVSFKEPARRDDALEFTPLRHRAEASRIDFVADLAAGWAGLRRTPRAGRGLACILSDYPAKGGREGYAVGLDTPASVAAIASALGEAGYDVALPDDPATLMRRLDAVPVLPLARYRALFATLPAPLREAVTASWGDPADDPVLRDGVFHFRLLRAGRMAVALQPDRGRTATRKAEYHDGSLPPCHAYVAFYLWLRHVERVDAVIHLGTHGTLEWLPGKAVALSADCAPEALLGPLPLVYPFIVNNPGEAAQAKRRSAAVTIGHLTPPLMLSGSHGAAPELEALLDEYAQAEQLDPRRAALIARTVLDRAAETGLAEESGSAAEGDARTALARLDAFLCDVKEMRIGDGLHVFGRAPAGTSLGEGITVDPALIAASAEGETSGLLTALDGGFVAPGPAGAPSRGRLDVLPTGRNIFTIDPRAVPTPTAWEIGKRAAAALVRRYLQDHGDWPRRIVMDLWGSATMRTGGEELAQALALLGVVPERDPGSARVTGFTILPPAVLDGPRVDVTLRISGLFRDVFPGQIALFDQAVRAVAEEDEPDEANPLAAARRSAGRPPLRVFGAAEGSYGTGLARLLGADGTATRERLGQAYLDATGQGFGRETRPAAEEFRDRVAGADAFVHVQDLAGQDLLDADAFAEHEGGFAAAAALLGAAPALYHLDATRPDAATVRSLAEELARTIRGRAANPRWIAGQMRHGHRGAAEIAETVDNLFAFAVTTGLVTGRQFELVYDATLGDDAVRRFLVDANPEAARAVARRFDQAIRRELWQPRRNSVGTRLDKLLGPAA